MKVSLKFPFHCYFRHKITKNTETKTKWLQKNTETDHYRPKNNGIGEIFNGIVKPEGQRSCNAHLTPGPGQGERFCTVSQFQTGHVYTITWYKFWEHFKAFIISITLYQFQKDLFCLIILYDILFYFVHVHIAKWHGRQPLGTIFF